MIRAGNGLRLPNLYLIDKYFSINVSGHFRYVKP